MGEKPIVIVFISSYAPVIGGAELAVAEITRRLKGDFDFHIITHRLSLDLPIIEHADGIFVHRVGFGTIFDRMFLFPFAAAVKGFSLIKNYPEQKKILWGIMVSYASIGTFFIKLFKREIPFLLTIQEGDNEWKKHKLWWRLVFKKVDYVSAISSFLAGVAEKAGYGGPMEIVPNGVDEKLFEIDSHPMPGEKIIFSASRLVYKNGIDILFKAITKIKDKFDFKVVIAGDGKERKNLERLSGELGLEKRVEFLGNVPYEKLGKLYAAYDIFARPSRSEGLGSAFLEAMAAGLITIGTKVGGITDFLWEGKTGFLAKPEDVDSLAEALKTALILAPPKKEEIIGNARALIRERFLWDDVAVKMKNIFTKLCEY